MGAHFWRVRRGTGLSRPFAKYSLSVYLSGTYRRWAETTTRHSLQSKSKTRGEITVNRVLPIMKIGNPVLCAKTRAVSSSLLQDKKFSEFLKQMVATMHAEQGVGLAANQVAEPIQVFVLECRSNAR